VKNLDWLGAFTSFYLIFLCYIFSLLFFLLWDPSFRLILFFNFIIKHWIGRELDFIIFFDVMILVLRPKSRIWNVNPNCHWFVIYIYITSTLSFNTRFIRNSTSFFIIFLSMRIIQLYNPCHGVAMLIQIDSGLLYHFILISNLIFILSLSLSLLLILFWNWFCFFEFHHLILDCWDLSFVFFFDVVILVL